MSAADNVAYWVDSIKVLRIWFVLTISALLIVVSLNWKNRDVTLEPSASWVL